MNHIAEFQKNNGLNDDGVLGRVTIAKMCLLFGIKYDAQMAHFLANVHHETGGFKADTENLNYSAAGLAGTWPNRYQDAATGKPNALAQALASRPKKIANNVYANRMGNGDEASGDGWKFRGRGSLQLTGRNNYKLFSDFIKDAEIMSDPDCVATKYFWESALFYFTKNKLWGKMKGTAPADVKAVRKAVNGGYIGLEDVRAKFAYYYNLINK
ncbi:peptidoglycan-binding protein [Flavobacterium sp. DGU11]|uniref:Peptidoglycan-binding protein n=1 Tax=Flavobacterium arundinis TaxID=3139143 RepID=A0ABU9HUL4_9FLAO